jgi:hypothetical protein
MEEIKIAYKKKRRNRELKHHIPPVIPFDVFDPDEQKQIEVELKQQKECNIDEEEKHLEEIVKMYQSVLGKDDKDKQYALVYVKTIDYLNVIIR